MAGALTGAGLGVRSPVQAIKVAAISAATSASNRPKTSLQPRYCARA
jgi:hypothetical protein